MNGLLGPVTANPRMLAQAQNARNKPEFQMKANTPQGLLDAAALATSPVPILGDVVGLGADAYRFATDPASRTPLNYGLAALGLLPLLPAAGAAAGLWRGSAGPAMGGNQLGAMNFGSGVLSRDQILAVNKGSGLLSKAQRKSLFDPDMPLNESQQLGELGKINADILRKVESRKLDLTDPLTLRNHQRNLISKEYGTTNAAVDALNAGASVDQAIQSGLRHAEVLRREKMAADVLAEESKRLSRYFNADVSNYWNSKFADDIRAGAKLGFDEEKNAKLATVEAIAREAKKNGWSVEHTSKGGARNSSRYLVSPDGSRRVRLSDHDLPETQARMYNRSIGLTGKWDDEIVVNDWRHSTMQDYLNRLSGID